jgi:hypothetical protein
VPVPTNTPVPVPTNTPVPVPTNTPVPVPTNTPVPVLATNTSVPVLPHGAPTSTLMPSYDAGVPSGPGSGSKPTATNTPQIVNVSVDGSQPPSPSNTPANKPASTPTAVVVNNAVPGAPNPKSPQGQPKAAPAKPVKVSVQLRLFAPSQLVRPDEMAHLGLTYAANVQVRVNVAAPGQRPLSVVLTTDKSGHLQLDYQVPRAIKLRNGRATVRMTIQGVNVQPAARVSRTLGVSDMVVSVSNGRITHCVQARTVRVRYWSNTPLRVVLTLPNGRRVTIPMRTDKRGNASARLALNYLRAVSPVRMGIEASDARPYVKRTEHITSTTTLPHSCQKPVSASSITIGG